ncbi:MAG: hypothetical protein LBP54_05970, partial [Campylobacteraceae bacterium]|nr:hypothetical protein [Campylobacteraceae bacterium]
MLGLGMVEISIVIVTVLLIIYFIKEKALNIGVIIILMPPFTYALLQIAMKYDINNFTPASNTTIEGFVCEEKNQTSSIEQEQQKQNRIK